MDAAEVVYADLRVLPEPPQTLGARIQEALRLEPAELVFVHRDAEREPPRQRRAEIEAALAEAGTTGVPVVPVRMTEAWLLIDEAALRRAAGNPGGTVALELPQVRKLEQLADPKDVLHRLLLDASELKGRRRASFATNAAVHRLATLIEDYAPLRQLEAFQHFEDLLRAAVGHLAGTTRKPTATSPR